MKIRRHNFSSRKCKNCEVLKTLSFQEKEPSQEEYLSHFTSPESIIEEMNRLHNTFITVIEDQKYLIFWAEATKRYSQLLNKYHMELSTASPKNFQFESSLMEEACNGLEEFGLLKKSTKNQKN